MEQRSISNDITSDRVRVLKREIHALEMKKKHLQLELKLVQKSCQHEFIESAIMKKCKKCSWTESVYY